MPFLYTRRPPDFPPAMATAVLKVCIPALGFITRTPNPVARFNFGFCPEIQFGGIELRHRIFKRHRLSCLAVNNSPTMSMPLLKGGNNNDLVPTPIVVIDQDSDLEATMVEITFGDRLGALRDTNEIMKLKSDMQTAENGSLRIDGNTLNNEELNELRCQVAALRYQLEVADSKRVEELMEGTGLSGGSLLGHANEDLDTIMLDWDKDDEVLMDEYNEPNQTGKDTENIELTKRQYFAALIFAREMPGEESLVPAAEFRSRLESFLGIPSFSSFVSDPSTLHSLKKI